MRIDTRSAIGATVTGTLEATLVRIATHLVTVFGTSARRRAAVRKESSAALQLPGTTPSDAVLGQLTPPEVVRLNAYLKSPDLDNVAHHVYLARQLMRVGGNGEELFAAAREELRLGIRNTVGIESDRLFLVVDGVFNVLLLATDEATTALNTETKSAADFAVGA